MPGCKEATPPYPRFCRKCKSCWHGLRQDTAHCCLSDSMRPRAPNAHICTSEPDSPSGETFPNKSFHFNCRAALDPRPPTPKCQQSLASMLEACFAESCLNLMPGGPASLKQRNCRTHVPDTCAGERLPPSHPTSTFR